MKSTWSFTTGSSGDAAYDVWFGPNKAPTTTPAVELMILDQQRWQAAHRLRHCGRCRCHRVGRGCSNPVYGYEYDGAKGRQLCAVGIIDQRNQFRLATLLQGRSQPRLRRAVEQLLSARRSDRFRGLQRGHLDNYRLQHQHPVIERKAAPPRCHEPPGRTGVFRRLSRSSDF